MTNVNAAKNKWMVHWRNLKPQVREVINKRKGREEKKPTGAVNNVAKNNNASVVIKSNKIKTTKDEVQNRKAEINRKNGLETIIGKGNKGYDLLKKMGYEDGQSLGKDNTGILQPIMLEIKTDRKGLGAMNSQKVVTKKAATKIQQAATSSIASNKATFVKELQITTATPRVVTNNPTTKTLAVTLTVPSNKATPVQQKQITATSTIPHRDIPYSATNGSGSGITKKQDTTCVSPPETTINLHNTSSVTKEKSPLEILIESHSFNDPKFLQTIFNDYISKIELMQLRLEASASKNPTASDDNDLIVTRIHIANAEERIKQSHIDFLRAELIGWIGAYQKQELCTPIFHNMLPFETYISITCENVYSYDCLRQCIDDIDNSGAGTKFNLTRLPYNTTVIYCFDAIYEGVVADPELFLIQIQKHKPKLRIEHWMTIKHEVFAEQRRTYFMFLIDERSALALQFQYNSTCCICLQNLLFRNRGVVADE